MAACKTYTPPDVISDVPASVADAGSSDAAVTAAVRELTHAPVTSIFKAGVNSTPLKVNQSTEISFALPQELKDLFGKVKSFGIIGTRMDQNNRSPFSIDGFKEEDGTVSASIKPLRGAFSSAEDAGNTWHLVVGLGEGEEAKYAWYEFVVAGRTTSDDAGTRDVRRREDAGTTERDIPRPPREVTTREAGVRIRP
ncbi:hypothetical protein HZC35_03560 [Candidatus Saganbacteria bacterium]|nr:hypothetical protein [Candidatus Saganbacteria bacterium]